MKLLEKFSEEKKINISKDFQIFNDELEKSKDFLNSRNINTGGFLNYSDSYQKEYIYSNLFDKKFSDNNTKITQEEFQNTLEGLENTKQKLEELFEKYSVLEFNNEEIKKSFLEKIIFDKDYTEMLLNSVFLEAEKLGLELDDKTRKEKEKKVWEIQTKLYGPSISEDKEEQKEIVSSLEKLYENNFAKLNNDEQKIFEDFLAENGGSIVKEEKNNENEENIKKLDLEKEININNFESILEKYLIIQERLNSTKNGLLKMTDFHVIIDKKSTMISVNLTKKEIILPKTRKYKIEDLGLIDHELATHAFRGKNSQNNLGAMVIGNYIEAEEGNAMSAEYFAEGKKELEEAIEEPLIHFITNFIGEKYDFEKTKELIFLYMKMNGNGKINEEELKQKAHNRAVRVKGFYSLSGFGANMKDLAYYRGLKKVGKKILEAINGNEEKKGEVIDWLKQNYNIGKIGLDDLELFKKIIPNYKDEKLPLFLGKILFSKLKGEKIYFDKTPVSGKFNDEKLWKQKDFRFEYENISKDVKKMIIEILKILKK